jgi:hypothetical protein
VPGPRCVRRCAGAGGAAVAADPGAPGEAEPRGPHAGHRGLGCGSFVFPLKCRLLAVAKCSFFRHGRHSMATVSRLHDVATRQHSHSIPGTGFGAADTSRPPAAATAAGARPSRGAAEVQAALSVLRRSGGGGGDVCKDGGGDKFCNNGSGSVPFDARPADGSGGGDCSRGGGTASGGSGGRLNLSAYAALLAAFRVPDPSDAAPPTPEGTAPLLNTLACST